MNLETGRPLVLCTPHPLFAIDQYPSIFMQSGLDTNNFLHNYTYASTRRFRLLAYDSGLVSLSQSGTGSCNTVCCVTYPVSETVVFIVVVVVVLVVVLIVVITVRRDLATHRARLLPLIARLFSSPLTSGCRQPAAGFFILHMSFFGFLCSHQWSDF